MKWDWQRFLLRYSWHRHSRSPARAFLATSRKGAKSIKQAKRDLRRKTAEVVKLIEGQLRSEE